jgi:hypothetical protein
MECDARSRSWTVTFPWEDEALPTEAVVPTLGSVLAHAKYSRSNASVSIWYTFANAQRASKISSVIDRAFTVIRRAKATDRGKFIELPFDWDISLVKDPTLNGEHSDSSAGALECGSPAHAEGDTELDDDLVKNIRRFNTIRKRIRELDEESGTVAKKLKNFATTILDM